jgi:2-isopropylmalate synthase
MTDREKLRSRARWRSSASTSSRRASRPPRDGDFESVRLIAREIHGPVICGLARCGGNDIERAWQALRRPSGRGMHVFIATSPIHRQFKLNMSRRRSCAARWRACGWRARCADVEFSAEDAARTEPDFLAEVVEAVIEAGARTVNIPDTVGYAVPGEFAELIVTCAKRAGHRPGGHQRALPR